MTNNEQPADLSLGYLAHAIACILERVDDEEHPENTPEEAEQAIMDNASDCRNQLPYVFGDTNPLIQLNIDELTLTFDLAVKLMALPVLVTHPAIAEMVDRIRAGYVWPGERHKVTTSPRIVNRIRKFL